ncbi:hypothetical protein KIN20_034168 [Parelaphostrongylus tenuis]|uniref:Chondroitin proteoglycan 4 domain-containing protein n=1 Tax=Parelaphostrongylus tenuis TaxID=148309 RepID=A0AAD5R9Y6_PARTN|nr:hypothetical protein KIN20_034168 [Parelaphostrongylus tenuis]
MILVWFLSLFVTNIYGAAIPPQPVIPTTSTCLQGCFETGSVVNAAFDLLNFKSIAMDIENFCSVNSALLKCGHGCPTEFIPELNARTYASSFMCDEKIEEFRLVSSCLKGLDDVTLKCATECGVPTVVPLRLDSSPAASVNPTVFLDGIAGICRRQVCHVQCSQSTFNKECPGAGDLFMDMARHQVQSGIDTLMMESSNDNHSTSHVMTENYVKNLPSDCAYLKDLGQFEKVFTSTDADKDSKELEASTMFSSDKIVATTDEETEEEVESTEATTMLEGTRAVPDEEDEGFVIEHAVANLPPAPPSLEEDKEMVKEMPMETSSTIVFTKEHTVIMVEHPVDVQENETDVGMDVNAVDTTSPAPTEPVIVVDNTADDIGDNTIKAHLKDEVKSSATSVIISSTLLFAIASMLLI